MFVVRFHDLRPEDNASEKSLKLATLSQKEFPVPPGFVLKEEAFKRFLEANNIEERPDAIINSSMPEEVLTQLQSAYEELSVEKDVLGVGGKALDMIRAGRGQAKIAVRGKGFAVMNVEGFHNLQSAVKECWSRSGGELIVQKMASSEKAGVLFHHPSKEGTLLVESTWGLALLGGFNPDLYIIGPDGSMESKVGDKLWLIAEDSLSGKAVQQSVLGDQRKALTLGRNEVGILLELHRQVEDALGPGHDIEFGFERSRPVLLQAKLTKRRDVDTQEVRGTLITEGEVISPGYVKGNVVIVRDSNDMENVGYGDILVSKTLRPEFLKRRPAGLVTERGCIYRMKNALEIPAIRADVSSLESGKEVMLDGVTGTILAPPDGTGTEQMETGPDDSTVMGLKAMLSSHMQEIPEADGVVIRAENILTERGNPSEKARENPEDIASFLEQSLESLARKLYPKPVWYRGFGGRTDELQGFGEEREPNPALGWHGIKKSLESGVFSCELEAFKRLYEKGLNNLFLLLPFISLPEEIARVKERVRFPLKLGVMIETPGAALSAEEICREGIYCAHLDLNSLVQLTLGVDMDNHRFSSRFSSLDDSVKTLVSKALEMCRKYNIETSVSGEACNNPETLQFLQKTGAGSIAGDADSIEGIKRHLGA